MYLDSEKKKEIFGTYGKSNTDTGSPEAQIALFSVRIAHLTEHLKANKKDHTTQRALKMLVGKRRRLLDYLIKVDIERYRAIIAKKELGIRQYFFKTTKKTSGCVNRRSLFSSHQTSVGVPEVHVCRQP